MKTTKLNKLEKRKLCFRISNKKLGIKSTIRIILRAMLLLNDITELLKNNLVTEMRIRKLRPSQRANTRLANFDYTLAVLKCKNV
jgi:hypothetical protein